jgi:SAM-dependent methyltransferase
VPDAVPDVAEDTLLAEQRAYYRQRAPEYDEWWQRVGPYDRGDEARRDWERQVAVLEDALGIFGAAGNVLELAGGTGWWTERLARTADRLTVVDSSPETLAISRARLGSPAHVDYVVADLFGWAPSRRFDVVFFSFWLSHVPRSRFGTFWDLVRRCLAPAGRVFLIDNARREFAKVEPHLLGHAHEVHHRTLNDGSEHRLVKIIYASDELTTLLDAEGWEAEIQETPLFVFGSARPRG